MSGAIMAQSKASRPPTYMQFLEFLVAVHPADKAQVLHFLVFWDGKLVKLDGLEDLGVGNVQVVVELVSVRITGKTKDDVGLLRR